MYLFPKAVFDPFYISLLHGGNKKGWKNIKKHKQTNKQQNSQVLVGWFQHHGNYCGNSFTSTDFMSSFKSSTSLLFGLPPGHSLASSNLSILLPTYSYSPLRTYINRLSLDLSVKYQACLLSSFLVNALNCFFNFGWCSSPLERKKRIKAESNSKVLLMLTWNTKKASYWCFPANICVTILSVNLLKMSISSACSVCAPTSHSKTL